MQRLDAALPIGVKLALPMLCIALGVGGILAGTIYRSEANRIRSDYKARAFLASESIRVAATVHDGGAQSRIDYPEVQRHIDALAGIEPSILRIDLFEVNGQASTITASSDHSRINTFESDAKDLADEIRATRAPTLASHDDRIGQADAVHLTVPFDVPGRLPLAISIHLSAAERNEALAVLLRNFVIGVGAAALFALVALVAGLRVLIFRRIDMVLRASDRLQSGDFGARVEHLAAESPRDEMLRLACQFNGMAASIEELHAEVEVAATVDQLTGLYNRRFVMDTLDREIARARRHGEPLSVIMIDLDGLKEVNDRLGHLAGDEALRYAADALRDVLRDSDCAARLGGDEFVAVLPGCDSAMLGRVLDRLQLTATRQAAGEGTTCTVSAGGAVLNGDDHAQALLDRADTALYEAKRAGKNRSRVAA
jgi:diguanylate cyclase (GGDEF)-like protein